jgi:hypothetical protein
VSASSERRVSVPGTAASSSTSKAGSVSTDSARIERSASTGTSTKDTPRARGVEAECDASGEGGKDG